MCYTGRCDKTAQGEDLFCKQCRILKNKNKLITKPTSPNVRAYRTQ